MDRAPKVSNFTARQCGWLKRADLEDMQLHRRDQVWEKPNGELYITCKSEEPIIYRVDDDA